MTGSVDVDGSEWGPAPRHCPLCPPTLLDAWNQGALTLSSGEGPQDQAQGLQVLRAGVILAICLELCRFPQDKSGASSRKPTGLN